MLERIKELVAENLGVDEADITETSSFKEDLGADSLDLFEMVTVGDVISYIESHKE